MTIRSVLVLLAVLSLAAETSVGGTFEGLWRPVSGDTRSVSFSYHREQIGMGRIHVELPTGEHFVGQYLRLTGEHEQSRVERIFARWRAEGFDTFDEGPAGKPWNRAESALDSFRRKHHNRLAATLISDSRSTMRCSFALAQPSLGLAGGASGRCQITDGSVIDVPAKP